MIDARAGVIAGRPRLRRSGAQLRQAGRSLVANKSEGRAGAAGALEAYALGLGEPVAISAEHGEGLSDLYDALRAALPEQTAASSRTTMRRPTSERAATARSASRWSAGRMPASRR